MTMRAIHGDEPWPEDNGEDLDDDVAEEDPLGGQSHNENPA